MPGGLLQIAVYGTQDIFLTGTPQITFFKMVYRRHTNFAMEQIPQVFDGAADFGRKLTCVIDKVGDLLYKLYVEIDIPAIALIKDSANNVLDQATAKLQFEQSLAMFNQVYNYTNTDTSYIRNLDVLLRTNNVSMADIEATFNSAYITPLVTARNNLIAYMQANLQYINTLSALQNNLIQQINQIDIQILFNSVIVNLDRIYFGTPVATLDQIKKTTLLALIEKTLYPQIQNFYDVFNNDKVVKEQTYNKFLNGTYVEYFKAAWVEELGHAIIDSIDIYIGGGLIDRQTADWVILWNQLSLAKYQIPNYNEMIGNVPKLTTFDAVPKPAYKLIIPIQFWFCRYHGLALPLVSLRYPDIVVNMQLKDIQSLFYYEDTPLLLDPANVQNQYNIHLGNVVMYCEYVYLDSDERRRFAQAAHEYLIEQVQFNTFTDLQGTHYNARCSFSNPCKFLVWFAQPNQYRENPTGRNKCQWNNFGIRSDGTGFTYDEAWITFNTYNRIHPSSPEYFNYVQPWQHFTRTPSDGISVYSFSLVPEEQQPASSANMSRLVHVGVSMDFSAGLQSLAASNTISQISNGIFMAVYTVNYNILRFMSGMGGTAFQISA